MRPLYKLALVIIPLGLIIAAVPENTTKQYKLDPQQLVEEIKDGTQFLTPDAVADMLVQKDPTLQLIDVRSKDEFDKFSLPNAINIPLTDILSPQYEEILNQGVKMNVFYSNGATQANEVWMICRQLGYQNNYVLQGGLNHWAATILYPQAPSQMSPDDEFAKYDFRKGANQALGGGSAAAPSVAPASGAAPALKGIVPAAPKKKRASGGC